MYTNNPYAQAGWYNPANSHSINGSPWRSTGRHPPTFGVLPSPDSRPASVHRFEFVLNQNIFTATVTGPNKGKYFDIRTTGAATTIFKPSGGQSATVIWANHPTVEGFGVSQQRTGNFLRLSSDQSHRIMAVAGRNYAWVPRDHGIYLYSAGPNPPEEYARLTMSGDSTKIMLEITSESFQAGLFEPCIISAVLLFCARNID